jgi:hypothetical protein
MNLVDDIYLVAAAGRRISNAGDNLVADILDTSATCGVKLINIRVRARCN